MSERTDTLYALRNSDLPWGLMLLIGRVALTLMIMFVAVVPSNFRLLALGFEAFVAGSGVARPESIAATAVLDAAVPSLAPLLVIAAVLGALGTAMLFSPRHDAVDREIVVGACGLEVALTVAVLSGAAVGMPPAGRAALFLIYTLVLLPGLLVLRGVAERLDDYGLERHADWTVRAYVVAAIGFAVSQSFLIVLLLTGAATAASDSANVGVGVFLLGLAVMITGWVMLCVGLLLYFLLSAALYVRMLVAVQGDDN